MLTTREKLALAGVDPANLVRGDMTRLARDLGVSRERVRQILKDPHPPPRAPHKKERRRGPTWDAGRVHALRQHLELSQRELADELGTRQQTISEWETGQYRPRGTSARLLTLVAERAGFRYEAGQGSEGQEGT